MGYQQITLGLTLTVPTSGTRNWGSQLKALAWDKISQHAHTGAGDGNQINTAALVDSAVTAGKLASNSVTTAKITDLNVTTGKLANLSVTSAKIAVGAVTTGCIATSAVTSDKIAPNLTLVQAAEIVVVGNNQSTTLNFGNGNIQILNLTAATGSLNITLNGSGGGGFYTIFIKQPAVALTMNWPVEVKWPQGQAPIFTASSGAIDSVSLYYHAALNQYWADWQVNYV